MTDMTAIGAPMPVEKKSILTVDERTRRRNKAEVRFRLWGKAAVTFGIIALIGLLLSIMSNGMTSFQQTYITLNVFMDPAKLDKAGNRDPAAIAKVTTFAYAPLIEQAMAKALEEKGLVADGLTPKAAAELISKEAAADLRRFVIAIPR